MFPKSGQLPYFAICLSVFTNRFKIDGEPPVSLGEPGDEEDEEDHHKQCRQASASARTTVRVSGGGVPFVFFHHFHNDIVIQPIVVVVHSSFRLLTQFGCVAALNISNNIRTFNTLPFKGMKAVTEVYLHPGKRKGEPPCDACQGFSLERERQRRNERREICRTKNKTRGRPVVGPLVLFSLKFNILQGSDAAPHGDKERL